MIANNIIYDFHEWKFISKIDKVQSNFSQVLQEGTSQENNLGEVCTALAWYFWCL